jgi:MEMO1 family protein
MERHLTVRPCRVCGLFYRGEPGALRTELGRLLDAVDSPAVPGVIRGLIAPHAGYQYSGPTAARAYALLRGASYETVVVVAPSHREYFEGVSVYSGDAYETPLGLVPIDGELRDRLLAETSTVQALTKGHGEEHAIEVQLPFLQYLLPRFSLLPVVIGDQRSDFCLDLGHALGAVLRGKNVLLVASTDLSHHHPALTAQRLDQVVMDDVTRFDAPALLQHLEHGETEACGGGPVIAVMTALRDLGVGRMTVLHHCTSGEITGDRTSVVGYFSAAALS